MFDLQTSKRLPFVSMSGDREYHPLGADHARRAEDSPPYLDARAAAWVMAWMLDVGV
jgi:hypothetical protein